jgi:4-diphosphocytidyl-2-C-methyl-D-erythritol kinase
MLAMNVPRKFTRLAPAKLNLFLHVTGRRDDGFHLLQSVFMRIDWYDKLHFLITTDGKISRKDLINTTGKPLPEIDLSVRAAMALKANTGTTFGALIGLEKGIPSEAGMGGGSSDAATTLLALNDLWQTKLSLPQLCEIGIKLGADVPFFLHQSHAWVEGIGEAITRMELPAAQFLVVKPPLGISTPAIFGDAGLVRNTKTATIEGFAAWLTSRTSLQGLDQFGCNDLQPIASKLNPQIAQALDWFAHLGFKARITGSGSAVFAQVPDSFDLSAAPSLPVEWQCRLCSNKMKL